jgi:hypothetical protein
VCVDVGGPACHARGSRGFGGSGRRLPRKSAANFVAGAHEQVQLVHWQHGAPAVVEAREQLGHLTNNEGKKITQIKREEIKRVYIF